MEEAVNPIVDNKQEQGETKNQNQTVSSTTKDALFTSATSEMPA